MKIIVKLIIPFLLFLLIIVTPEVMFANSNEQTLRESITTNSINLAESSILSVEKTIYDKIELFQAYATDLTLQEVIKESNQAFEQLDNRSQVIATRDQQWVLTNDSSPFIQEIVNNDLSGELREKTAFYNRTYGYNLFSEVFVTNKYGVNIAETGKTTDYYQADEDWWQQAKAQGLYVQDERYDMSAGVSSIAICIRIDDAQGQFLGVMKVVYDIREINTILNTSKHQMMDSAGHDGDHVMNVFLLSSNDTLISTTAPSHEIPTYLPLLHDKPGDAAFTYTAPDKEQTFVAYARTPGYASYAGLGWTLVVEHEAKSIMQPVTKLNIALGILFATISFIVIVSGFFVYFSIVKPIVLLEHNISTMSLNELDQGLSINSKDEIGKLAGSFKSLVARLHLSQQKVLLHNELLEKEVADRTQALHGKVSELEQSRAETLKLLEDLKEAMQKQKQLERVKTEFLSVTSHELRTPVTPMKAQLQMLLGGYFGDITDEQKKSLDLILLNTNQLDTLISDILDISKLESGSMKFRSSKADINAILKEVTDIMQIKANDKHITIAPDAQQIPPFVMDKERIRQVLINLVNNAIKFSKEHTTITVRLENKQDHVLCSVVDQGIGIDKKDQERLFKPFSQVDSSMSRPYEGSGLGLAISKGIIKNHGGTIGVQSELGKGATFFFTLPYESTLELGVSELELFDSNMQLGLHKFKKLLAKDGYALVSENAEELMKNGFVNEDGKMRYDVSLAQLEGLGFIKKSEGEQQ